MLGGKLFVSRNAKGVSPPNPFSAFDACFGAPRRVVALRALVRGFAASASGGKEPFSEEKGSLILTSATTEKIVKAKQRDMTKWHCEIHSATLF